MFSEVISKYRQAVKNEEQSTFFQHHKILLNEEKMVLEIVNSSRGGNVHVLHLMANIAAEKAERIATAKTIFTDYAPAGHV